MNYGAKLNFWKDSCPWDYRVAYFLRTDYTDRTGYFDLQRPVDINPLLGQDSTVISAFGAANFRWAVVGGFGPGGVHTGDIQNIGCSYGWWSMKLYNGKWRPASYPGAFWYQPTLTEMPVTDGYAYKFTYGHNAADGLQFFMDIDRSDGQHFSKTRTTTSTDGYSGDNWAHPYIFANPDGVRVNNVMKEGRFFECKLWNDHPTYGINVYYICVMKGGSPYIADAYSGKLFANLGGTVGIGPRVPDNYDPMTWVEPT